MYSVLINIDLYYKILPYNTLKVGIQYKLLKIIDHGNDIIQIPLVCLQLINKYLVLETIIL